MIDDVPSELTAGVASMPASMRDQAHVVAAGLVCAYYLGSDFVAKFQRDRFFESVPDPDGFVSFRFGQRVLGVGETLFLLRKQPGFAELLRRFRKDDLRATYFECLVARLFHRANFAIRAEPRRGIRGRDFDFQAVRNEVVNVEITALEQKPFSARTLSNTIQSKRNQLSADAPGAIFVLYPASWVQQASSQALSRVATDVFNHTGRINALVFLSEEMRDVGNGEGVAVLLANVFRHPSPRMPTGAFDFLETDLGQEAMAELASTGDVADATWSKMIDSEFLDWVTSSLERRAGKSA